jgi:hypothetical protein
VSAPESHDPLVVNTQDGSCWMRHAVTCGGKGLYALAGTVSGAPDVVLSTMAELAEHGLASVAFALPMPVGVEPRTLGQVEDELTGVSLSLYEEQLDTARLRLALASAQRGRREARALRELTEESRKRWRDALLKDRGELEGLRAEVAVLREERHSTNESVSEAAEALRVQRDRLAELESTNAALRARLAVVEGQRAALAERLRAGQTWRQDRLVSEDSVSQPELRTIFAIPLAAPLDGITRLVAPVLALREEPPLKGRARLDELTVERAEATHWKRLGLEDPHESPLHRTDRIPHDLPPLDGAR